MDDTSLQHRTNDRRVPPAVPTRLDGSLLEPLSVSQDGHFLQQPDGTPFFWLADTAWEIFHRLTREEVDQYLKDRAEKGFTVIQAVATGKLDSIGLDVVNRYGELPFVDRDPCRPNEHYFDHVDWVIDCALRYGLRVGLVPIWAQSFVCGDERTQVMTSFSAEIYGRWLGERYRGKGLIWLLGGDVTPLWPDRKVSGSDPAKRTPLIDYRPVYDAMAVGIAAGERGRPFITFHPSGSSPLGAAVPRTSLYFSDRNWLDMNMLQSSHFQAGPGKDGGGDYHLDTNSFFAFHWNGTLNHLPVAAEYGSHPSRPVVDGEPCYEDHPIYGAEYVVKGFWQSYHIRNSLYKALFAGAAGHSYGHVSVWDFHDPSLNSNRQIGPYDRLFKQHKRASWQVALNAPGATQMRHAKALMLSRPYFSRIPDQQVIVDAAGTDSNHIVATRDQDGSFLMVYVPQGEEVCVDLTVLSGSSATAWWFDPRIGKASRSKREILCNQSEWFTPPTSAIDQDWILVLDDASKIVRPPGSK